MGDTCPRRLGARAPRGTQGRGAGKVGAAMAVLAVLIAIAVACGGVFLTICSVIRRRDKWGSLRIQAPTTLGRRVQAITGAHAARWGEPGEDPGDPDDGGERRDAPAYV